MRFHLKLFVGIVSATLGMCFVLAFIPRANISEHRCSMIRPGMRVQEVEEIIGAPPGWYDGVYGIAGSLGHEDDKDRRRIWVGQDGKIVVVFDFNGRVGAAEFSKVQVIAREPLAMIWERVTRGLLK